MSHINISRHKTGNKEAFNMILTLPHECIAKWMAEISSLPVAPGSGGSSMQGRSGDGCCGTVTPLLLGQLRHGGSSA